MCSNVYDDVADFEVCGFINNTKRKSIRDTLDPMEMEENSFLARSSRLQMFFKIGVLENFEIFTGKHLY